MAKPTRTFAAVAFGAMTTLSPLANAEPPEELVTELSPLLETGLASTDVAVQAWAVRSAALSGLDSLEETVVAGLENVNPPVRVAAAQALIRMGEHEDEAEAVLVTEMLEGGAAMRGILLNDTLISIGGDVREDVIDEVLERSTEADVTQQVVLHLARRADGDLYDLLDEAADIADADARAVYVNAVRTSGRPIGVTFAEELLESSDPVRRLEGAEIAFAINNLDARALLEPLLDSDDSALAQRVGAHLAQYGNAAALGRTAELAMNPEMDEALRMDAMALLRDSGPQLVSWESLQPLLQEDGRSAAFKTRVYELAAATQDPTALDEVRGLLDGLFADERLVGISAYGYSGQLDAIDTLGEILGGTGDLSLRLAAAAALGHLGGDTAADVLVNALRAERVDTVKVAIVTALGQTGSAVASQAVANTFALRNAEIALAAIEALQRLGDASIAPQIESASVSFREREVRWAATVALTHLDPELGRIRLLQALERPPEGFREDIAGLPESVLQEVDEQLLMNADSTVREPALFRVMAQPDGGYAVLRPLVSTSVSPDVRRQAIAVITAAGNPDDADLFRALAEEGDRSIRLQGFAALAELGDVANEELFRGYLNHADVALRLIATYALLRMHS